MPENVVAKVDERLAGDWASLDGSARFRSLEQLDACTVSFLSGSMLASLLTLPLQRLHFRFKVTGKSLQLPQRHHQVVNPSPQRSEVGHARTQNQTPRQQTASLLLRRRKVDLAKIPRAMPKLQVSPQQPVIKTRKRPQSQSLLLQAISQRLLPLLPLRLLLQRHRLRRHRLQLNRRLVFYQRHLLRPLQATHRSQQRQLHLSQQNHQHHLRPRRHLHLLRSLHHLTHLAWWNL